MIKLNAWRIKKKCLDPFLKSFLVNNPKNIQKRMKDSNNKFLGWHVWTFSKKGPGIFFQFFMHFGIYFIILNFGVIYRCLFQNWALRILFKDFFMLINVLSLIYHRFKKNGWTGFDGVESSWSQIVCHQYCTRALHYLKISGVNNP